MTNGVKRNREEIENIVNDFGYFLLDEYIFKKGGARRIIIQDETGYKYDVALGSLMSGYKPEFVNKNNPFTLENISLWLKINHKDFELSRNNVYCGSNERLNLYCFDCGDSFTLAWHSVISGQNCSVCSGQQIGKYNSLEYLRPDIAAEWNYSFNNFLPGEVTEKSGKKAYFTCSKCSYGKNGEWYVKIYSRSNGQGCPACSGRVLTDRNRLSIKFPKLIPEWHPILNGNKNPENTSYGYDKKVYWVCLECGYGENGEWFVSPNSRTNSNTSCPACFQRRNESLVASELKKYFIGKHNAEKEYKILKNLETKMWLPYDIYIPYGKNPNINGFYIEVHGIQHYEMTNFVNLQSRKKNTTPKEEFEYNKKLDKIKGSFARKNGIYIEVDLRKIKTGIDAINFIENKIRKYLDI